MEIIDALTRHLWIKSGVKLEMVIADMEEEAAARLQA